MTRKRGSYYFAWKQENALDFETYKELASRRSAQLCERFVEALAEAHTSE